MTTKPTAEEKMLGPFDAYRIFKTVGLPNLTDAQIDKYCRQVLNTPSFKELDEKRFIAVLAWLGLVYSIGAAARRDGCQ